MRFIGGKSLMLEKIQQVIEENTDERYQNRIFDCFAGSGVVSEYFKNLGYSVVSNDVMYMSYVLCRGGVGINRELPRAQQLIDMLNGLTPETSGYSPQDCFIYKNYSPCESSQRMYFQNKNALKIDIIRRKIEEMYAQAEINEDEYFYLLARLISAVPYVSNIAGVYGAYLKHWDKRTYNDLELEAAPLTVNPGKNYRCYHRDIDRLAPFVTADIAYVDPPYNQRQYVPNYHVLETIARYDSPALKGVTGMRPYDSQRSDFCIKNKVIDAFDRLFRELRVRYIILSYNNEGLVPSDVLAELMQKYGRRFKLYEYDYRRYKNKIPNNTKGLKEQIYFIEKDISL